MGAFNDRVSLETSIEALSEVVVVGYGTQKKTDLTGSAALYIPSSPIPYFLSGSAGGIYTDQYMFRLAETYLLRAEAYLGLGNTALAADDINVVRARSNAAPIVAGDVDIDYILDERMREFGVEEKRILTLMRMGKCYDRLKLCDPDYYGVSV